MVVIPRPSNSLVLIDCFAYEISFSGIARPLPFARFFDFTTTSVRVVALDMVTLYVVLSNLKVWVFRPT